MKDLFFSGSASNDTHVLPYWITVDGNNTKHVLGKVRNNDNLFHIVKVKSANEIIASGSIEELVALGYGLPLTEYRFRTEHKFSKINENGQADFFAPIVIVDGVKMKWPTNGVFWFIDKQIKGRKPISVVNNVVTYEFTAKCHIVTNETTILNY